MNVSLQLITAIIALAVVAVFFAFIWSVWGPQHSKLRLWLCRRMHGDEIKSYAGGEYGTCWCGLKCPAPWRNS